MIPPTLSFYISLDSLDKAPLHMQLSDKIRDSILTGRLKPGEFLPATRSLAQELGLSRFTVSTRDAYADNQGVKGEFMWSFSDLTVSWEWQPDVVTR